MSSRLGAVRRAGAEKGAGTGCDALDDDGQPIPFTVTFSGTIVTYTFEKPPTSLFWVWMQLLAG